MNQAEEELCAVCQGLAEDGELTEHEVRYLAEWLSQTPAACELELGGKMQSALNEILADGSVNEEELQRLAPLISEAISLQYNQSSNSPSILPTVAPQRIGFVAGVKNWLAGRKAEKERQEFERREMRRALALSRQRRIQEVVSNLQNGTGFLESGGRLVLQQGEQVCWKEPGVLKELKVVSRRYEGSYAGTRIRVAKGVSFTVGGSRGRAVAETGIVEVSRGEFSLTTKRLIFAGDQKSIAVKLEKLVDVQVALSAIQFSETGKEKPRVVTFNSQNGDIVIAVLNFVLNNR